MKERVKRTIDHQTSPKQPDSISRERLRMHLSDHANEPWDEVVEAIEELLEDGELEETKSGRLRLPADSQS